MADNGVAPSEPSQGPQSTANTETLGNGQAAQSIAPVESAGTQADSVERKRTVQEESEEPSAKRAKIEDVHPEANASKKVKGIALVKAELVDRPSFPFMS